VTGKDAKAQVTKRELPTTDKEIRIRGVKHWNNCQAKPWNLHLCRYLNLD